MIILAHRGWWTRVEERNSPQALGRALRAGYGLETDIRDHDGELVISHDPPTGAGLMTFEEFARLYRDVGAATPLALNIKADGLQTGILRCLLEHDISNYFVFDMAVPDAIGYVQRGLTVWTRQSIYEHAPSFYGQAAGVWVDCFNGELMPADAIDTHLKAGKSVALVSPELHGLPHEAAWKQWLSLPHRAIMLCTDFPDQAEKFFND